MEPRCRVGDRVRIGEYVGRVTNVRVGTPRSRDNYRVEWDARPRVPFSWVWASEIDEVLE